MLDDIRNSTLLVMVSAVAMAVVTIVLQPQLPSEADAAHKAGGSPARVVTAAHTPAKAQAQACETPPASFAVAPQFPAQP